jgi:hypothetical protein
LNIELPGLTGAWRHAPPPQTNEDGKEIPPPADSISFVYVLSNHHLLAAIDPEKSSDKKTKANKFLEDFTNLLARTINERIERDEHGQPKRMVRETFPTASYKFADPVNLDHISFESAVSNDNVKRKYLLYQATEGDRQVCVLYAIPTAVEEADPQMTKWIESSLETLRIAPDFGGHSGGPTGGKSGASAGF